MRIDDKSIANYSQVDSLKKQDNAKPKSDTREKVISSTRDRASYITDQVKNLPDVRQERVDQLRNQIENGTYNVSGKKVAEKIVGTALDNLF